MKKYISATLCYIIMEIWTLYKTRKCTCGIWYENIVNDYTCQLFTKIIQGNFFFVENNSRSVRSCITNDYQMIIVLVENNSHQLE